MSAEPRPLHPRVKDITGQVFGRLTVEAFAGRRLQGAQFKTFWSCQCSCGRATVVEGYKLRSGHTTSCGCWHRESSSTANLFDLTAQVFGRLTVLRRAQDNHRGARWECSCSCGSLTVVCGQDLRSGDTRSCGCWTNELIGAALTIDLAGQRFSRLTVLRRSGSTRLKQATWVCICDCGRETVTSGTSLRSGKTTSCGCRQREVGKERLIDRVGQRYGRLVVMERVGTTASSGDSTWRCICDCGNEAVVGAGALRNADTRSCGCLATETRTRHGLAGSVEYQTWDAMIQRCTNPKAAGYKYYGGRGISVDPHWLDFANFYADMGPSPGPGYTIDRINVDGHYGPGQCRWATRAEQARNRRNNRFFTLSGETLCLTDWAKRYGISVDTVGGRLRKGLDIEAALTTPPNPIFSRRKEAA